MRDELVRIKFVAIIFLLFLLMLRSLFLLRGTLRRRYDRRRKRHVFAIFIFGLFVSFLDTVCAVLVILGVVGVCSQQRREQYFGRGGWNNYFLTSTGFPVIINVLIRTLTVVKMVEVTCTVMVLHFRDKTVTWFVPFL